MKKKFTVVFILCFVMLGALASYAKQEQTPKEKIRALYGENKKITGQYDQSLAVKCINGTFVGKKDGDVLTFKGIPYVGEQPTGQNAFKAPIPFKEDNGVYEAYYFGKSSIQCEDVFEEASLYYQGDDSLKLNVWTNVKDKSTDKPVLIYIHGGAFDSGGTVDPLYDGYNFVNSNPDAILVTITYRLNYHGFIDLSAFDDFEGSPNETPYNFGLLDQVEALRWVNSNIENFGGDKDKITIFGQSAGAMSVGYLCCIEEARNYFKNAIIMSPMGIDSTTKATLHSMTENLKKALNITTIEQLRNVTLERMNEIPDVVGFKCGPATDDRTMFKKDICSLFEDVGREGKINIIQGFTKDESHYLISACGGPEPFADLFEPTVLSRSIKGISPEDTQYMMNYYNNRKGHYYDKLADMLDQMTFFLGSFKIANSYAKGAAESENGGSIYSYLYRVESSEPYIKSGHSVELPGLFGNPCKMLCGRTFDEKLGRLMQRMWINFAKTGNPSVPAEESPYGKAFDWTKYTQKENAAAIFDEFETHMDTYKNIGLIDERIHSILNNGKSLWGE